MAWKHYEDCQSGTAWMVNGGIDREISWSLGAITTGRQRVFHRYFVQVVWPDGTAFTGEDEHSLRAALFDLDQQMRASGAILLAAGLEPDFAESGLSYNSSVGYLADVDDPVHMLSHTPPRDRDFGNDQFVEGLIREAVAGMFAPKPIG